MPVKKAPRVHYTPKKPAKHYLKVYWPYLPTLISLAFVIIVGGRVILSNTTGVLGYAVNTTIQGLLAATNQERSQAGTETLSLNPQLTQAAQAKANDMAARNYWSHVTPEGDQPWVFVEAAGYDYRKAGENLAYGFATSDATVAGWMNSQTHRENMLDRTYTQVGFGFANAADYQNGGEQTIVVAMYGLPQTSATEPATQPPSQQSNTPALGADEQAAEAPEASPLQVNRSETSTASIAQEPATQSIAAVQALTDGSAPWSGFAVGLLAGGLLVYLIIKHALGLKRGYIKSRRFILHHPLLDIIFVSLILVGVLLSQTAGFIR